MTHMDSYWHHLVWDCDMLSARKSCPIMGEKPCVTTEATICPGSFGLLGKEPILPRGWRVTSPDRTLRVKG